MKIITTVILTLMIGLSALTGYKLPAETGASDSSQIMINGKTVEIPCKYSDLGIKANFEDNLYGMTSDAEISPDYGIFVVFYPEECISLTMMNQSDKDVTAEQCDVVGVLVFAPGIIDSGNATLPDIKYCGVTLSSTKKETIELLGDNYIEEDSVQKWERGDSVVGVSFENDKIECFFLFTKDAMEEISILTETLAAGFGQVFGSQNGDNNHAISSDSTLFENDSIKGRIELADTSKIEVLKEDIEVTKESIDYYINQILESMATTETLNKGTVEMDDIVNIDYFGKLKSSGEVFDDGAADDFELQIGSGTFIDGFEDGLIGKNVGETVNLDLTFPEDYHTEHLKGQDVSFTVTINNIQRTTIPKLTDEFVRDYSKKYCSENCNTIDEFRKYVEKNISDYYLFNAIYGYLADHSEILDYDEEIEKKLMEYSNESLEYYAEAYGMNIDDYVSMSGYADAEEYNKAMADQYLDIAMVVDAVCKKKDIIYTEKELNDAIEQYMKDQKYIDHYSVDEFIEESGETWLWLFTNLEFRFDKAMNSLKDNVIIVDKKTE